MFSNFDFDVIARSLPYLFYDGMTFTLTLTVLATVGGIFFGTLLALMRLSGLPWLAIPAAGYVNLMRSVPLVLMIFWFYFLVPYIGQWLTGAERPIQVGSFMSSWVTFTLFEAAYFCEIMRAGIYGEEESIFYGIGTIVGGEPDDSGLPYETLSNEMGIPWGVGHSDGDPACSAAVILAQGSLIAGVAPGFATSGYLGGGTVFTAVGDVDTVGPFVSATLGQRVVRELTGFLGDFNNDGFVDAADYTVWRNNLGDPTEADINNNGDGLFGVDEGDYGVWTAHYGESLPMPGGGGLAGGQTVPEPASILLLAGAAGVLFLRPKTRFLRHVRVS